MIDARIRYLTTRQGFDIAFATHGQGPPLLFAGAVPFCHAEQCVSYNSQLFEPLTHEFQLGWFDFLGCGLSQRADASFELEDLADAIGAVADALGWSDFHLLGRNGGAMASIAFAARNPARVRSLIAVEAWLGDSPPDTPFRRVSSGLGNIRWGEFTELLAIASLRFLERERAPRLAAYMRACVDQAEFMRSQTAAESYKVGTLVPEIACPTLFVDRPPSGQGEYEAKRLAARTPGSIVRFAEDPIYATLPAIVQDFCGRGAQVHPGHAKSEIAVASPSPLSARELDVLRLIAIGRTNAAIGEELCISTFTVNRHVSHIFEKLNLANRAEAAAWAAHHGVDGLQDPD